MASQNEHLITDTPIEPYEMVPISATDEAQAKRGWTVEINGHIYEHAITTLKLTNSKFGATVEYADRPEGHDGVVISERGGGGAVTIPYMVGANGELFIGMVRQYRPTMGGWVWNVPRGSLDAGETHQEAAGRELHEETGHKAASKNIAQLAVGLNPNSTWFETTHPVAGEDVAGISIHAVKINRRELVRIVDPETEAVHYEFPLEVQNTAMGDSTGELILGSRFMPIKEVKQNPDMLTSAAAGQLMTSLFEGELPYMDPEDK